MLLKSHQLTFSIEWPRTNFVIWQGFITLRINRVMLEDRIKELKPTRASLIPSPTRVAKGDLDGVRDTFEAIAKGTAIVE